jgi:hypothetical protein
VTGEHQAIKKGTTAVFFRDKLFIPATELNFAVVPLAFHPHVEMLFTPFFMQLTYRNSEKTALYSRQRFPSSAPQSVFSKNQQATHWNKGEKYASQVLLHGQEAAKEYLQWKGTACLPGGISSEGSRKGVSGQLQAG